jgi:hypothetical protein
MTKQGVNALVRMASYAPEWLFAYMRKHAEHVVMQSEVCQICQRAPCDGIDRRVKNSTPGLRVPYWFTDDKV